MPYSIYQNPVVPTLLVPLLVCIMPIPFAIFLTVAIYIAKKTHKSFILYSIGFSFGWIILEYIRSNIFFPFQWALVGHAALHIPYFSQIFAFAGVYIAGLLINLMSTSLFSKNKLYISINLIIVSTFTIFGYLHQTASDIKAPKDNQNVRIVQPYTIFSNSHAEQQKTLDQINKLSKSLGQEKIDLLIWPEGSLPYAFFNSSNEKNFWRSYLPPKEHSALIFGIERVTDKHYFNSLIALNRNNLSTYDKHILVPFGEYVPLISFLPTKIARSTNIGGFTVGKGKNILTANHINILPLICSESMLDHTNFNLDSHSNYDFILNISNDAWFNGTLGPEQHFALSRIRAIEYGLPVIRAGNNGPSGFINAHGEVLKRTQTDIATILDAAIPGKLAYSTIFFQYGHTIFFSIVSLYLIITIPYITYTQQKRQA
jgi:apolipoprotein N-acyltransferase